MRIELIACGKGLPEQNAVFPRSSHRPDSGNSDSQDADQLQRQISQQLVDAAIEFDLRCASCFEGEFRAGELVCRELYSAADACARSRGT